MRRALRALSLAACWPIAASTSAMAQTAVTTPALDPARVEAARAVVDVLFPAATREQMVDAMMRPMLANIRQGLAQHGKFEALQRSNPEIGKLADRFMDEQQARSLEIMRARLPGMATAMTNAYARRFDLAQLRELKTFFETPTGRAYMQQSMTIMSDPDVAAWQRDLMMQSMTRAQADIAGFARQVAALAGKTAP